MGVGSNGEAFSPFYRAKGEEEAVEGRWSLAVLELQGARCFGLRRGEDWAERHLIEGEREEAL
jgi:hypothetical protein